jgi:1-acyl-sn-glycerol-3-phosphate acyltransferase
MYRTKMSVMSRLSRNLSEPVGTIFTNGLAFAFYLLFPVLYDMRWHGIENFHASPSTVISINHKRDSDIIIIAPVLHIKRSLFHNKQRMHFLAREDLFSPGFLDYHFLPAFPFGPILHTVNLTPVMHAFRAHPISHITHKRLAPLLSDVIRSEGDIKVKYAVSPSSIEQFTLHLRKKQDTGVTDVPLSSLMSYRYRTLQDRVTDTGILKEGIVRRVRKQSLQRIEQQLGFFANILDDGGICLLAPEGDLSPDGRFWPVKSGLSRLLSLTKTNVTILPVNATYDFMTRKRMRVFVDVGKEIKVSKITPKIELEKSVQKGIVSLGRVTMGQLGSDYLLLRLESGIDFISEAELGDAIVRRVQIIMNLPLNLDDRLTNETSFRSRLQDFINFCLRHDILQQNDTSGFTINRAIAKPGGDFRQNPVQYSRNELQSLLEFASQPSADSFHKNVSSSDVIINSP